MIFSTSIRRSILLATMALGLSANVAAAQQTRIMEGRIWDFSSSHPDFENGLGGQIMTGQVESELAADGKPVWAGPGGGVFSSKEAFDEWYWDVPDVNMSKPFAIELVETPAGSGSYIFERRDFFPIDNELLGNEDGRFTDMQDQPRNFHYTMQLAGEFSFQSDSDSFTFTGDDDLWVFFGGKLGIDLGGTHKAATATINGAQLRELGLNPGQSYAIDVFFAERQSRGSNFIIQTNFDIQPPATDRAAIGAETSLTLPVAPGTRLERGQRFWSASGAHFLSLNPDGNLVVARADGGYVWGFDTQNVDYPRVAYVIWQEDGNLAAYAEDGSYIWSALTQDPDPQAQLVLQPDGSLQIAAGDRVLWSSLPVSDAQAANEGEPASPEQPADAPPLLEQTNTGDLTLTWTPDEPAAGGTPVAFVNTDETFTIGSRTVFILTNDATGEATLVPVVGGDSGASTVVFLEPGTYSVTPPPPSVGQFTTYVARDVSATAITVPEVAADVTEPVLTVTFGLDMQVVPVGLNVGDITATSVALEWIALPDIAISEYVLVRTDGPVPATSPDEGIAIPLDGPTATSAIAEGLEPGQQYAFALFSTASSGQALPMRSYTATTMNPGSTEAAYAVAANTILPNDFESLSAERVGENQVRVLLSSNWIDRGSPSGMTGLEENVVVGGGCVVGTPFLVTTRVAGDNSFYGVIDVCESSTDGVSRAIVNTDVPLSSVFNFFKFDADTAPVCIDPVNGTALSPDATECTFGVDPNELGTGTDGSDASELQVPESAGTGELQVTLLWASGDDLDLHITDPSGMTIDWQAPQSPSGGMLDLDDRGADCRMRGERAENVFWSDAAPSGVYTVNVLNYKACSTSAEARLQVRAGGEVVIDQVIAVGTDGPITFKIQDDGVLVTSLLNPAGYDRAINISALRRSAYSTGLLDHFGKDHGLDVGQRSFNWTPPVLVAQAGSAAANLLNKYEEANKADKYEFEASKYVKCELSGNYAFDMGFFVNRFFDGGMEVSIDTDDISALAIWNIRAGVIAGVNPYVNLSGKAECAVELTGWSFQLVTYPVPINLELKPDISGSASAKLSIRGPKLSLALGVNSVGKAGAAAEWCVFENWIKDVWYTCGVDAVFENKTSPIMDIHRGNVTASLEGELGVDIGVKANIGIGTKNFLTTMKAGFSFGMYPLAAEFKAAVGEFNCVAAELGAKLKVGLLAEAWVAGLGGEYELDLYESDILTYPNAEFKFGTCDDDDDD